MGVSLVPTLMIALSFPSLASAWCDGGGIIPVGIGVGVIGGVVVRPPPPMMMMKSSRLSSSHENNNCRDDSIISRRRSRRHPPPSRRAYCNVVGSSPRRRDRRSNIAVFELRSWANDDDDGVVVDGGGAKTTTDDDGGTTTTGDDDQQEQKMTLEKLSKLLSTFWSMAYPYYEESRPGRRLFIGMIFLTLLNSSVSVAFSYVSKDFWNALSSKDVVEFYAMMIKFGGALVVGAPVSVLYR